AAAAQTALAADFTAFGASTDFGGAAAFNIDGFFSGVAQGDGGAAAFDGKNIIIVGGDGADIATSSHLFVIDTGAPFAADAPLFAASVDINSGAKLGAAGGTAVAAGVAGAFQAAAVGVVIPEPGVSVLALFAAGFLALRRRR
ncbi:MAG: PEP-CTERM sorting domain-containing protein, partial [Verrucomicrobiales bacterium]|nr:PEP-CTERM sorting domain-containing protein [Verrucomicrobiales bacterium]